MRGLRLRGAEAPQDVGRSLAVAVAVTNHIARSDQVNFVWCNISMYE
jgi:hypothetical protein